MSYPNPDRLTVVEVSKCSWRWRELQVMITENGHLYFTAPHPADLKVPLVVADHLAEWIKKIPR